MGISLSPVVFKQPILLYFLVSKSNKNHRGEKQKLEQKFLRFLSLLAELTICSVFLAEGKWLKQSSQFHANRTKPAKI